MKFSEKLRIARKERGLTQPELARHLAVRASDVSDWENERSEPLESKYARLAMVLGVPEAYLTNDKYDYVDDVPEDMRGARTQPKTHVKDTLYAPRSDAPAGRKSSGNVDNLRKPGASETVQHSAGPRRVVT
ncbi:MAG: helix-turn-helix domain-containing protein, partial [Erysipelotrichaceae bacterium]|nr:helix-turn-helix domain-containing protein [Erysipelotrichaceae bacterium]